MSRWLYSEKAFKLFQYCASIMVVLGIFMAFMSTPWFWRLDAIPRADLPLRILGGALGVLGGPAALVIWFGMTACCMRDRTSSIGDKVLWFIVFFATAWFGSAVYFFSVYRPQVRRTGFAPSNPRMGVRPMSRQ